MISCDKAATICNKVQYNEASFLEKMKLRLHLLYCKTCKGFSKKNTELSKLCEKANLHSLTEQEKIALKKQLKDNPKPPSPTDISQPTIE
nr:hypothetical protein [Maribacter sp. MMG018]